MARSSMLSQYRSMAHLIDAVNAIGDAEDADTVDAILDTLTDHFGLDYLFTVSADQENGVSPSSRSQLEKRFRDLGSEYIRENLFVGDASLSAHFREHSIIYASDYFSANAKVSRTGTADEIQRLYAQHGLRFHASFRIDPAHSRTARIICMGKFDDCSETELRKSLDGHKGLLRLVGLAALRHEKPANETARISDIMLSPSERSVLTLLAQGWLPKDIARRQNKAINTVRRQVESARHRLGAKTTIQAITIAIDLGLVSTENGGG